MKKDLSYGDFLAQIYPENHRPGLKDRIVTQTVTFQVTDACNLACSYCYQINKSHRRMSFETAKEFIDMIIDGTKGMKEYINPEKSPGIIFEFIGGEPLLEIDLIMQICDYIESRLIEEMHPWATKHKFSISSNGVLYFNQKVQYFLQKYRNLVSLSISIDGNKELHDACRCFPDGSPSYDLVVAAVQDYMSKGFNIGSKITLSPANIQYTKNAIVNMIDLGYTTIYANCVYEKGWEVEHAKIFYQQLKELGDYILENNLEDNIFCSLFDESSFHPLPPEENQNWCGGTGVMLACDPDGLLYPCIRYMESSIGTEQPPLRIGDVRNGIAYCNEYKNTLSCLKCITRRSQSTDECFYCPIAAGCAWCSGYNYQLYGTANKRATFICIMHQARALGNCYFWNKYYKKHNINKAMNLYLEDEKALQIVDDKELKTIKGLIEM